MPTTADRDRVLRLVEHGAQLVEVLPRHGHDEEHLPDALHLPLKSLDQHTAAVFDGPGPSSSTAGTRFET